MAIANGASSKATSITKEVLQTTASKIGITVPKHLVDDLTELMADGYNVMEEVNAMEGKLIEAGRACIFT